MECGVRLVVVVTLIDDDVGIVECNGYNWEWDKIGIFKTGGKEVSAKQV